MGAQLEFTSADVINVELCRVLDEEGNELNVKTVLKTDLIAIVGVLGMTPTIRVKVRRSHYQVAGVTDGQS